MSSETKRAKGGLRDVTLITPPIKVRLLVFALVMFSGAAVLAWVLSSTWTQLDRLRREHTTLQNEDFYLGITFRNSLRTLNGKLLQFSLTHNPAVRESFQREAEELKNWIASNRIHMVEVSGSRVLLQMGLSQDQRLLREVQNRYSDYLIQTAGILSNAPPPDVDTYEEASVRVRNAANPLIATADRLIHAQSEGFREFLASSQHTLIDHQRLLLLSSLLILSMALLLAVLVYRGMIAPLRQELSQSRSVLERQEKLASLGVLASGVAHEIRNPLTAIKFRLFSLKKALPALAQNEDAAVIAAEINRLDRIVQDFLGFARPSEPQLVTLPAEWLLKEVRDFLKEQLLQRHIEVRLEIRDAAWVHADAQQIKQVLINLIQNAAEAIERNGLIALRSRLETVKLAGLTKAVVILSVSDTGRGMPPAVQARLFDPFFTTKEGGTGLGLAIAARIVEKHGGLLRYETFLNRGTTFEVVLPRVEHHEPKDSAH